MELGFPKAHHNISPRGKSGCGLGLGKLQKIWGSSLIFLQRLHCPLGVSRASCCILVSIDGWKCIISLFLSLLIYSKSSKLELSTIILFVHFAWMCNYTVSKKRPMIFSIDNFAKCLPIFKILSPLGSARNL